MDGNGSEADLRNWDALDGDPTILPLEFMEHGDLYGMIQKIVRAKEKVVPSTILWKIFFCRKNHFTSHVSTHVFKILLTTSHGPIYSREGLYRYAAPP